MSSERLHLIERAAERLRGNAKPAIPDMPPLSDVTVTALPPVQPDPLFSSPPRAEAVREDLSAIVTVTTLVQAGMVIGGRRGRPAEEYRITASNLVRNMPPRSSAGANLLMVTSTSPSEGKSFSAINLAASIAQNGLSEVLLVDADPKVGSITSALGLSDRPGLFDFAAGNDEAVRTMVVRTEIPGLSIVPLGSNRVLSSERGITQPVAAGITRLGRTFSKQIVILDAPPCLATSDPSMLASLVGQIVMIVEAQRTQRQALTAALNLVKACPSITLLLNKARIATTHSFGDYSYYGS